MRLTRAFASDQLPEDDVAREVRGDGHGGDLVISCLELDYAKGGSCYRLIFATTQGPDLAGIVGAGLKLGPMG